MFGNTYEQRLREWQSFREVLETSEDPIQLVIDQYSKVSQVSRYTDPWSPEAWPMAWELISENTYCDFCVVLGMYYSLQLTDRFSGSNFEIHIGIDREQSASYYLLIVDKMVIGYDNERHVALEDLPSTYVSELVYHMPLTK